MNVPNTLSAIRLALIPVFGVLFMMGEEYYIWAGLALALSALSDLLDGYFARKLNQITDLGKWLDPIADKLTLGVVVACMWIKFHEISPIITPAFAILIIKEVLMAIGGMIVLRDSKEMVGAKWWGKVGTAVFYSCMLAIVLISMLDLGGIHQNTIIITLVTVPAAVMLFAFVRYFMLGLDMLRSNKAKKNAELSEAASVGKEDA